MIAPGACSERSCKHYKCFSEAEETEEEDSQFGPEVCRAYPDGIPERILDGTEFHLIVQPDQEGTLVYEEGEMDLSEVYALGELRDK